MVQTKKMNEAFFERLIKDFDVVGELVRARQDEKQAIMDQFVRENKRFISGKISEKALASSVKKTNKEIARLDKEIRDAISRAKEFSDRARKLTSNQAPKSFRATIAGLISSNKKKSVKKRRVVIKKGKVVKKKKVVKKAVFGKKVRKKELSLDKKFSKR